MRYLFLFLALLSSANCQAGDVQLSINGVNFDVELAITQSEHNHGLMGRTTLETNRGMLFVYDEPRQISFWMKSTLIPLDILFFDSDGTLLEFFADTPPCKKEPCKTYTNQSPAQYVLEVSAGTARRLKLKRGDTFTIIRK
jgi:hypothetical protein